MLLGTWYKIQSNEFQDVIDKHTTPLIGASIKVKECTSIDDYIDKLIDDLEPNDNPWIFLKGWFGVVRKKSNWSDFIFSHEADGGDLNFNPIGGIAYWQSKITTLIDKLKERNKIPARIVVDGSSFSVNTVIAHQLKIHSPAHTPRLKNAQIWGKKRPLQHYYKKMRRVKDKGTGLNWATYAVFRDLLAELVQLYLVTPFKRAFPDCLIYAHTNSSFGDADAPLYYGESISVDAMLADAATRKNLVPVITLPSYQRNWRTIIASTEPIEPDFIAIEDYERLVKGLLDLNVKDMLLWFNNTPETHNGHAFPALGDQDSIDILLRILHKWL